MNWIPSSESSSSAAMRTKVLPSNGSRRFKILLPVSFLVLFALYAMSSGLHTPPTKLPSAVQAASSCVKIPPSLASALVHYATSNVTPQQTHDEISVAARVLQRRSPCNFLVFGLGHDSPMWSALNHGGRTVFLEEDESWIRTVTRRFPALEAYHVKYDTRVSEAEALLELSKAEECTAVAGDEAKRAATECPLALKGVPSVFHEVEWDVFMVDAPTGYFSGAPGRMGAIYEAGMAARGRSEGETDVFVHDVDRVVEDKFSRSFLCEGYMKEEEGRLRHFVIPSHVNSQTTAFCP